MCVLNELCSYHVYISRSKLKTETSQVFPFPATFDLPPSIIVSGKINFSENAKKKKKKISRHNTSSKLQWWNYCSLLWYHLINHQRENFNAYHPIYIIISPSIEMRQTKINWHRIHITREAFHYAYPNEVWLHTEQSWQKTKIFRLATSLDICCLGICTIFMRTTVSAWVLLLCVRTPFNCSVGQFNLFTFFLCTLGTWHIVDAAWW